MTDTAHYRKEHILIFGHEPIPDLLTGRQCVHPVHDMITSMMNAPGVDVEVPFDGHEVITEDDPEVTSFQKQYDEAVDSWKDVITEIEDREAYEKRTGKK